jgi:hypothetical protein
MMIKDSTGNKSMTATLAYIAFFAVTLKFLLSGVTFGAFSFGIVDSFSIAALLGPTLGAYTARRWGVPAPSGSPAIPIDPMDDAGSKGGDR